MFNGYKFYKCYVNNNYCIYLYSINNTELIEAFTRTHFIINYTENYVKYLTLAGSKKKYYPIIEVSEFEYNKHITDINNKTITTDFISNEKLEIINNTLNEYNENLEKRMNKSNTNNTDYYTEQAKLLLKK